MNKGKPFTTIKFTVAGQGVQMTMLNELWKEVFRTIVRVQKNGQHQSISTPCAHFEIDAGIL
jgi:predicted RNA-binding protein with PIN domain